MTVRVASPFGVRELAPAFGPRVYPQRLLAATLDHNAERLTERPGPTACRNWLCLDTSARFPLSRE